MKKVNKCFAKLNIPQKLSAKEFVLYRIEGDEYDFTENLNFPENQDGVYIFCTSDKFEENTRGVLTISKTIKMLYCGRTIHLRTRFDKHHHMDDLKKISPLFMFVAFCENQNENIKIENSLLNYYNFTYNDETKNCGTMSNIIGWVKI